MTFIQSILNPERYHGHKKAAPFFEGWYFKMVSANEAHKMAVIPGVFLGENGYAFIQVLDGNTGKVVFARFPLEEFWAAEDEFEIRIGRNIFRLENLELDFEYEGFSIQGQLNFLGVKGWPVRWVSPGVMGWYAWVPRMECYHGVLGFDHAIQGKLTVNQELVDFTDGRGYIEKDWGAAFPEGYVWMQTNHFSRPEVSLTGSIAMIPWLGSAFRGFIVGLWMEGKLYRFATYTGAKTDRLEISDEEVVWQMSDRKHRLEIRAVRGKTGDLKGPTRKDMGMRVAESLTAEIEVRLLSAQGEVLFADTGRHGGLEVAGDLDRLLSSK